MDSVPTAASPFSAIGCEDPIRNDRKCVGWGVQLYLLAHSELYIVHDRPIADMDCQLFHRRSFQNNFSAA